MVGIRVGTRVHPEYDKSMILLYRSRGRYPAWYRGTSRVFIRSWYRVNAVLFSAGVLCSAVKIACYDLVLQSTAVRVPTLMRLLVHAALEVQPIVFRGS